MSYDTKLTAAEFGRYCKSNRICSTCGLDDIAERLGCECFDLLADSNPEVDRIIKDWCKGNPAAQYPTWQEWLTDLLGCVPKLFCLTMSAWDMVVSGNVVLLKCENTLSAYAVGERIPYDIARTMGIAPKDDNRPLTTEELMEMDGERVWVVELNPPFVAGSDWRIVETRPQKLTDEAGMYWGFGAIGRDVIKVYRRKPEAAD